MRVCFGLPIVEGAHVDPVLVLDPIGVAGFEDPSNGIIKELPGSFDVHGRKDAGGGVVDQDEAKPEGDSTQDIGVDLGEALNRGF